MILRHCFQNLFNNCSQSVIITFQPIFYRIFMLVHFRASCIYSTLSCHFVKCFKVTFFFYMAQRHHCYIYNFSCWKYSIWKKEMNSGILRCIIDWSELCIVKHYFCDVQTVFHGSPGFLVVLIINFFVVEFQYECLTKTNFQLVIQIKTLILFTCRSFDLEFWGRSVVKMT
jgi:hypothetical protein